MDFGTRLPLLAVSTIQGATALIVVTVQGILLLGLVAIFMAIWRSGSAARRHAVWVAALAGLLALPVLSRLLPGWNVAGGLFAMAAGGSSRAVMPVGQVVANATQDLTPQDASDPENSLAMATDADETATAAEGDSPANAPGERSAAPRDSTALNSTAVHSTTLNSTGVNSTSANLESLSLESRTTAKFGYATLSRAAAWLLGLWGAVAAVLLLRLAAGQFGLWLLARRSRLVTSGKVWGAVERMRLELSIGRSVRLYLGRARQIPMTWGLLTPHVLLPSSAHQWSDACQRSVLLHELAHVRRRDCQTKLLVQIACALNWLNPLVWLAARQIDVERERACDDVALAGGIPAIEYAENLVEIASGMSRNELAALAMVRRSRIAGRVTVILNEKTDRRGVTGMIRVMILAALAALVLLIAMLRVGVSAGGEKTETPAVEKPSRTVAQDNTVEKDQEEAKLATSEKQPDWSDPIEGLQFRLTAPRTAFQAWELPTFVFEVRNAGERAVTAQTVEQVFDPKKLPGLRFLFKDHHKRSPNPNRWVTPDVRVDFSKLVGLKPGETMTETVPMVATRDEHYQLLVPYALAAGRYTIGLGALGAKREADLKTNSVTLTVLPPGVRNREELARFLKPYRAGDHSILAGFVPNKTTLVEGEPLTVTLVVENQGDSPFSYSFGGDYRGIGRHNRFKIEVVGPDGAQVEDPLKHFDFGGISGPHSAQEHDTAVETVELLKYRTIAGSGTFKVTCRFDLRPARRDREKEDFNVLLETTYELTIVPREPENVQRVLGELFVEANQTGSLALEGLIETIGAFGQGAAVPGLKTMGVDGDVEHRVAAAKGLGKIATPSALEALLKLNRDPAVEVRVAAIASLGAFTDGSAAEAVVQAITGADEAIRVAAAAALGQMKTDAAVEALIERLPKSDPEVTAAILRGMGTSQSPRVLEIIVRSLENTDDLIRRAALDAIVNFPAIEAAKVLRKYAVTHAAKGFREPAASKPAKSPKQPEPGKDPREAELREILEQMVHPVVVDPDADFLEAVVRKLAENLRQPIEMDWLTPVIKSHKGDHTIGHAPTLMRLYGGEPAVAALVSCLDFENPTVRSYYNSAIVDAQLACRAGLAVPWHSDLNRDGTPAETEENRQTLRRLKAWLEYCQTHPVPQQPLPQTPNSAEDEKTWGEGVDDLSIRAQVNQSVWPAGMPQVVSIEARDLPGAGKASWGTVRFSSRPEVLEVEINSEWYSLSKEARLRVCGKWSDGYHSSALANQDLQLDGRWLRKTDGQPLELMPGNYTVRVAVSQTLAEKRTGLAMSKPVKFEVIPTQ